MPHSGGYIVWVHNAFGPALALLNGTVNLLCNVFDCALYPLLLAQYVERALYPLLPPEPHGAHGASWWRELAPDVIGSCLRLAVVALAAGVNVLGTSVVAIGMVAFMFLVSPPLLALVLASYAAPNTAPLAPFTPSLQEPPTTAAQWHFLLALVMWNNCGYDSAGKSPALACEDSLRRPNPLSQVRLGGHGRLGSLGRATYLPARPVW